MATAFNNYDDAKTAFINPKDVLKEISDFPELCVTTFSEKIIEKTAQTEGVKQIAELYTANGTLPVYEICYKDKRIAFYLSRVGAPACVAGIEEIIALGARKIVLFGSCGVLDDKAVQDKIVIPISAVRDEGTSYHYIPASEEIRMQEPALRTLKDCLIKNNVPYTVGKVWTTDAIYRETHNRIRERKAQGCIAVEMECAAALALTEFRGIPFAQFLFGADNLDGGQWEIRDLMDHGLGSIEKYMAIACECVGCL